MEYKYTLNGSQIVAQEWEDKLMVFFYDESGSPIGYAYRTTSMAADTFYYYVFVRNLQGDIVAIYNTSGVPLVSYTYDAWGNVSVSNINVSGTNAGAQYNPLRYRGYYYDEETGLYYLNSRYYDPSTGRFLNADNNFSNWNLYMYCENNSPNASDPNGEHWYYLWLDDLIQAIDELMASLSNIVYGAAAMERFFYDPMGAIELYNSRPFQDVTPSPEMQIFAEVMYGYDFLADVSVSYSLPQNTYVKVGISNLLSPSKDLDATYVHLGMGESTPSILPVSVTCSVGIAKNVYLKEDYSKFFNNRGASFFYGVDYGYWPNGSSSYSITFSNSYGVYNGVNYYWCIS